MKHDYFKAGELVTASQMRNLLYFGEVRKLKFLCLMTIIYLSLINVLIFSFSIILIWKSWDEGVNFQPFLSSSSSENFTSRHKD